MTCTDLKTRPVSEHRDARSPARKGVLFCSVCGHESPIDGDWTVADDDSEEYVCPNCERVVAVR